MEVRIVTATRYGASDFQSKTALGQSLKRLAHDARMRVLVTLDNRRGLPLVYNDALDQASSEGVMIFIHDDVWIDDYYMIQRVFEGLESFDVIGVAGNRRRIANQPSWHFVDEEFHWDDPQNLSGSISHGPKPGGEVQYYGSVPAACELLDGVFLAARTSILKRNQMRFDPRFDFHFYDLDFCRTARQRKLKLGTWPICLTHQGSGIFGTAEWRKNYAAYLTKWGD